jgi:hypothetical protein
MQRGLIIDPNKRLKTDPNSNPSPRHRGSIPGMKPMSQPGRPDQYRSAQGGGDFRPGGYPPQQYQQGPPPQQVTNAPASYQAHPLQQQQAQVLQ